MATKSRKELRRRRHQRVRTKVHGTADRPRLAVCASGKHLYAQLIDDDRAHTLASVSTLSQEARDRGIKASVEGAEQLGQMLAEKALAQGLEQAVFDRGGFRYHGRVRGIAEGARKGNLKL